MEDITEEAMATEEVMEDTTEEAMATEEAVLLGQEPGDLHIINTSLFYIPPVIILCFYV